MTLRYNDFGEHYLLISFEIEFCYQILRKESNLNENIMCAV